MILLYVITYLFGLLTPLLFTKIILYWTRHEFISTSYKGKALLFRQLKTVLREIAYKYYHKQTQKDFLLNIIVKGELVIQILHRSHFIEFAKNVEDVDFGLVLYMPTDELSPEQKSKLKDITLIEGPRSFMKTYPYNYLAIDLGLKFRAGWHLISLILNEVYGITNDSDVSYELFDEGPLPYNYPKFD